MAEPKPPTPLSPAWKRPKEIMRIRSKRRNSAPTSERPALRPFNTSPQRSPQSSPVRKRRNPFTCSPNRKRLNLGPDHQEVNVDSDFILFQMLDKHEPVPQPSTNFTPNEILEKAAFDDVDSAETNDKENEETDHGDVNLPLDWSLKTKVKFLSETPFTCSGPIKTVDEAKGVSLFVRESAKLPVSCDGDQSELKSASMYWMHPNLPWLNLFPRQVSESRIGKASSAVLDEHMISQLHRDWCQSFSSLFNLLKAGSCPYFYVLSHQFSVLFRTANIGDSLHALLTPTTRGLREALSSDGITFKMPLLAENKDSQPSSENSAANSMEDEHEIQTSDTGASMFLESIGVDKQKFPELNPNKVKLEREDYKRIDNRPESLILVEDGETKSLFDYLLNCRSCIANTGVQRGIPPTLLAPTAFNGATLKSNQIKHGTVRQTNAENIPVKMYTLEVFGAVLPDSVARLAKLFSRTQTQFIASFSTHEPTTTFNDVPKLNVTSYYPKRGGDDTFLSIERNSFKNNAIRSMEFKDGEYFCSG